MLSTQDRWEISDLLARYCFAVDSRDMAALDDVFTEDAECIFQTGACSDRKELKLFISSVLSTLTATQHNLTSSVATETNGAVTSQTYLVVQHTRADAEGGETFAMGGTYHDLLRPTRDGWRIYRRELVGSWRSGNPAVLARPPA